MGRKRKKREEASGPKGAPEWVVTFTDMISLLVTFFVLLMTFSSMDTQDAMKIDSFLIAKGGIHKTKGGTLADLGKEDLVATASLQRGASAPHSRPADELVDSLDEMGQKNTDKHKELDLSDVGDGVLIEFGTDETFDPGSARIPESLRTSLVEIGEVLSHYPHLVVVEGFTDSAFKSTVQYGSAAELSLARARAAAATLLANTGLESELVQIAGLGDTSPVADNVSPGGRRENRRVRLRVLSLSKMRATQLAAMGVIKGDQ